MSRKSDINTIPTVNTIPTAQPFDVRSQERRLKESQLLRWIKMWCNSFGWLLLTCDLHLLTSPRNHYDCCFVTSHQGTWQCSHMMILCWPTFGDTILKSPWRQSLQMTVTWNSQGDIQCHHSMPWYESHLVTHHKEVVTVTFNGVIKWRSL